MTTGTSDEVLEVGYFSPDYTPKNSLSSGEIGYIVTGLKEVSQAKVGDTITQAQTHADNKIHADLRGQFQRQSALVPLEGYKEVKPMVFAGIYTVDGEINKLR